MFGRVLDMPLKPDAKKDLKGFISNPQLDISFSLRYHACSQLETKKTNSTFELLIQHLHYDPLTLIQRDWYLHLYVYKKPADCDHF